MVYYHDKLKRFWDELHILRSFSSCTCGILSKCSCDFLKRLSKFDYEEKLMQFLLGLDCGFDNAISSILAMDPLPSISRAFYLAEQMEKQKEVSSLNAILGNHEISAFVTLFNKSICKKRKNCYRKDCRKDKVDRSCDFCKKQGHIRDTCFKLKGFPEWFTKKYGVPSKVAAHVSTTDYTAYKADNRMEFAAG